VLALNPIITAGVQLAISNPSVPDLDGFPVHACGQIFTAGYFAKTCTYCPEKVVPHCPNSTETVVFPGNFLVRPHPLVPVSLPRSSSSLVSYFDFS